MTKKDQYLAHTTMVSSQTNKLCKHYSCTNFHKKDPLKENENVKNTKEIKH